MPKIHTKERILNEALICFANDGYKGTNLRDLAARLNLSKSALYRHFSSKEDIWNAMLDQMIKHYNTHFETSGNKPPIPNSCEELRKLTMGMINFTINDEKIILTRKVLLVEQFHDERARELAGEHFLYGTKRTFTEIFNRMIEKGVLIGENPEMMAFEYTAPITVLIHASDREPERKREFIEKIEDHIQQFIDIYSAK